MIDRAALLAAGLAGFMGAFCLVGISRAAEAPSAAKAGQEGERFAAWASSRCRSGPLDVDNLLGDAKTREDLLFYASNSEASPLAAAVLKRYAACRELAEGGDYCGKLKGAKGWERDCRAVGKEAAFIRAVELDPVHAMSACLDLAGPQERRRCRVMIGAVGKSKDPALICERKDEAGFLAKDGMKKKECLWYERHWEGRAQACDDIPKKEIAYECRQSAALVAALRAHNQDACRANPLCAALSSGGPKACAAYGAELSKAVCAAVWADMRKKEDRQRKLAELQKESERRKEALRQQEEKKARIKELKAAEDAKKKKKQFKRGQPMQEMPPDVKAKLKAFETRNRGEK